LTSLQANFAASERARVVTTLSDQAAPPAGRVVESGAVTMVTAVWGDWHITQLLEMNLPTLLAPGNLPSFTRDRRVVYEIFTRENDRPRLAQSPIINRLRESMEIEFTILAPELLGNPIAAHHHAWEKSRQAAARRRGYVLYLPPDVAWSDGSFQHLAQLLDSGRRAIFMTYLRAESASFTAALRAGPRNADDPLVISGRELVGIALQCLHPLMAASLIGSPRIPRHPEMLFWPIKGEGLSLRVLAREMFLYDPNRFDLNEARLVDGTFDPSEIHFISDSDDLFAVSLAELGKDIGWHMRRRRADPAEIGRWWLNYDSPINDVIARHKIRWHATAASEEEWRRRERAGDRFIRRCAVAREGLRLRMAAQEFGCSKAAQIVAFAIFRGILARAIRGRGPMTILLPSNEAFRKLPSRKLDELCQAGNAGALSRLLRAHCIPGLVPSPLPTSRPPVQLGAHRVYIVDACQEWSA